MELSLCSFDLVWLLALHEEVDDFEVLRLDSLDHSELHTLKEGMFEDSLLGNHPSRDDVYLGAVDLSCPLEQLGLLLLRLLTDFINSFGDQLETLVVSLVRVVEIEHLEDVAIHFLEDFLMGFLGDGKFHGLFGSLELRHRG